MSVSKSTLKFAFSRHVPPNYSHGRLLSLLIIFKLHEHRKNMQVLLLIQQRLTCARELSGHSGSRKKIDAFTFTCLERKCWTIVNRAKRIASLPEMTICRPSSQCKAQYLARLFDSDKRQELTGISGRPVHIAGYLMSSEVPISGFCYL